MQYKSIIHDQSITAITSRTLKSTRDNYYHQGCTLQNLTLFNSCRQERIECIMVTRYKICVCVCVCSKDHGLPNKSFLSFLFTMLGRTSPVLSYFCVYNPSLAQNEENTKDQILYYTAKTVVPADVKMKQVGLAQALVNFSSYDLCCFIPSLHLYAHYIL